MRASRKALLIIPLTAALAFATEARAQSAATCCAIRNYPDPSCPDVQPKSSVSYTPAVNGCGPQNNAFKSAIIGFVGTYGTTDFTPACSAHDTCYGTCNAAPDQKDECDAEFLDAAQSACAASFANVVGDGTTAIDLYNCNLVAHTFYSAVQQWGAEPFNEGQLAGCNCCDDCYCAASTCTATQTFDSASCTCTCATGSAGTCVQPPVPASCTICPAPALETGGGVPEPPEGTQYVCQNAADEGACTDYTNTLSLNSGCYSLPNVSCTPCGAVASGNNCFLCPNGVYLATYSQYGCEEPAGPDYGFPFVDFGDGAPCESGSPSDVVSCEQVWP